MNPPTPPAAKTRPALDPVLAGTACCAVSSLSYTGANLCMRKVAALGADPMWATFNKEAVTVVVVGLWLLVRALCGRAVWPPWRTVALLAAVGLAVQLGGNLGVQWALGVVGLAVVVPAVIGVMLTAGAVLGRAFLGERVPPRSAAAVGLLLLSLVLLGLAARPAGTTASGQSAPGLVMLGLGAACGAGAIYAVLTTTIRHAVTRNTPMSIVLVTTTSMAVLTLGPWSVARLGISTLCQTPPEQMAWILAGGTLNLLGFLAITTGLQWTTVVHANVLNASQVAMAAVGGMILFQEPLTFWLILGVCLTIVGVLLISRPEANHREADQHA